MTPSLGGFLSPSVPSEPSTTMHVVQPSFVNTKPVELLNRLNGKGLSATYRFTRCPHLYSPSMTNINVLFTNTGNEDVTNIRLGKKNLAAGMSVHDFACITRLPPNCSLPATLGIDFNDTTQPANFEITSSLGTIYLSQLISLLLQSLVLGNFNVCIKPSIGELLRPLTMSSSLFLEKQSKLKGMNEHTSNLSNCKGNIVERINEITNLGQCQTDSDVFRYVFTIFWCIFIM